MRRHLVLACALLVGLTVPATAHGDTYTDITSGNDSSSCTAPASPCQSIQGAVGKAGPGETVHVDGGTYNESVTLSGGKSLIEDNFNTLDGNDDASIDGGTAAAITVAAGNSAGTIQGFTLLSDTTTLSIGGIAASVTGNTFQGEINDDSIGIEVNTTAAASTIGPDNFFTDDAGDAPHRIGIQVTAGSPTIISNTFSYRSQPIYVLAGSPVISANTISHVHVADGSQGGTGIAVVGGTPTIVENNIHSPEASAAYAITIDQLAGTTGATLRRNTIFDHPNGVHVFATAAPVTLFGDLIRGSTDVGLFAGDYIANEGTEGNVSATNVTLSGNAQDIQLGTTLTLNSTIVEDPISTGAFGTCIISFSRGPSLVGGSNGCGSFQTTAAPMFLGDNYHLFTSSSLIDAGDPAAPAAPDGVDLDGDPRTLDGTPACTGNVLRRDIGADEFVPVPPTGCDSQTGTNPGTTPPVTTAPLVKRKKCKKVKKGAAAARKCKRKGK